MKAPSGIDLMEFPDNPLHTRLASMEEKHYICLVDYRDVKLVKPSNAPFGIKAMLSAERSLKVQRN